MTTVQVRRVATVLNGGTPTADEANWGGDVPWATPVDMARAQGGTITSTDRTLTTLGLLSGRALAPENSVLLSTRAPIGYTALLSTPTAFNQGCKALVPRKNRVDPRFLQYSLISRVNDLKAAGSGSTFLELSSEALSRQEIHAVGLGEQRMIADFLDDRVSRIDRIIAARREQMTSIRAWHDSSIRAITETAGQASRPTGVQWHPMVAEGWNYPRVAHVFDTGSGSTPPSGALEYYGGAIPWVTTGDVVDAALVETAKTITERAISEFSTLVQYPPGTLLVAMYGQGKTKGRVAMLEIQACVNQACCAIQGSRSMTEWAFFWFRAHKKGIVELANGAGQPNLSQDIIRSLRLPLPGESQRNRLLSRLRELDNDVAAALQVSQSQVRLLTEYKSSLITAAVTGELDVSTAGSGIPG